MWRKISTLGLKILIMKTQRKKILIVLTLIFSTFFAKAQFTANAGNDTITCEEDTLQLGYFPSAYGGIPPYTYVWEASYTIGINTFYASTFLNDTTIPNPLLITQLSNLETLTFKLTVTDSLLNVAVDSVTITFSKFSILLVDNFATINQGDSVQLLNTINGGIPPLTYQWTPNYNLSDSTDEYPWAKPDTTTFYICTVTDSNGCKTSNGDIFEVYVNPSNVIDNSINSKFKMYPNPSINELTVEYLGEFSNNLKIEIYNTNGKLELIKELNQLTRTTINTQHIPVGIYFIVIKNNQEVIATQKWVKQ